MRKIGWLTALLLAGCGSGTIHGNGDGGPPDGQPHPDAALWDGGALPDGALQPDGSLQQDAAPGQDAAVQQDAQTTGVTPPIGGSSGGSGGTTAPSGAQATAGSVGYIRIVPAGYQQAVPARLMIVYSGTEGAQQMTNNLLQVAGPFGLGDVIFAVLDGVTYYGNGAAGATVLDHVRSLYNIDNDRTFLLSESAGTSAGLQLGLDLRQSYFAAYWANDVNASATPVLTAGALGFAPWGNAGPGGDFADANAIVAGMQSAGYRLPADAPYSGTGSGTHGSPDQFMAAISFFNGKSRL
ncbi:MAG: hypothetical protein ABI333_01200 [bacterium]